MNGKYFIIFLHSDFPLSYLLPAVFEINHPQLLTTIKCLPVWVHRYTTSHPASIAASRCIRLQINGHEYVTPLPSKKKKQHGVATSLSRFVNDSAQGPAISSKISSDTNGIIRRWKVILFLPLLGFLRHRKKWRVVFVFWQNVPWISNYFPFLSAARSHTVILLCWANIFLLLFVHWAHPGWGTMCGEGSWVCSFSF